MSCVGLGRAAPWRKLFAPALALMGHLEERAERGADLNRFSDIAVRYLESLGFEPHECASEDEARGRVAELITAKKWPVYFFARDTKGEKDFEEFYTDAETLHMERFENIGVILNEPEFDDARLGTFLTTIQDIRSRPPWDKPRSWNCSTT